MKKIIIFMLFGLAPNLYASVDCARHSGYCQIRENNRELSHNYAMLLSNVVHHLIKGGTWPIHGKEFVKCKLDKGVFLAMLRQESQYRVNAKNCSKSGINKHGEIDRVCYDFGIGQISSPTAATYGFSIERLVTDMFYSVEASMIVLCGIKRSFGKKEKNYWARYNAYQNSTRSRNARLEYVRAVSRWFPKKTSKRFPNR